MNLVQLIELALAFGAFRIRFGDGCGHENETVTVEPAPASGASK